MLPIDRTSVLTAQISSDEGYKSTHIRFRAHAPIRQLRSVACEIQVRTLFEDAWARISQLLRYKKSGDQRRTAQLLLHFAAVRDECDAKLGSLK